MPNIIVKTMTTKEAVDLMRQAGIKTSVERVQAGIQQGVYPWGEFIQMAGPTYTIYSRLFFEWLEARGERKGMEESSHDSNHQKPRTAGIYPADRQ